ncbi:MAG: PQQ-binding-like beta-propeller repeat protein, partial [Actinomycetota bacterium]
PRGGRYVKGDGYSGNYPATNAPWYNDGVLYASFSNGTVYALAASNGRKLWRFEVPAPGAPGEVSDHVLDPKVEWDFENPEHRANPLRAEVAPYTGDYGKFHSVVGYCDGKIHVDTLDSRMYVLDAATGRIIWHRYVGAPDWPGEFVWPEEETGGITPASGRSTRRFEADPGTGCLDGRMFVNSEDGYVKLFDADTGRFLGAYDAFHDGDLGFAHDVGAGLADPVSRDIIVNTLSNRMIRIRVPDMEPVWAHTEDAGQLSLCLNRITRTGCEVIPTTQDVEQDGPIGGAVFGGNLSIDYEHRVIANANQDGHLYLWRDIDVEGENPTLIQAIANGPNPLAKANPAKDSLSYYLPLGEGGPWERRTSVLSSSVMGGGVVYWNASWEHAIYGAQYLDASGAILDEPEIVFRYEVTWDDTFPYPPFGDTYEEPIIDIDLLTWGSPALVDGHLYAQANDGAIYAFNLQQPVAETNRNLVILGSGVVPFIPDWED